MYEHPHNLASDDVCKAPVSRRGFLGGSLGVAAVGFVGCVDPRSSTTGRLRTEVAQEVLFRIGERSLLPEPPATAARSSAAEALDENPHMPARRDRLAVPAVIAAVLTLTAVAMYTKVDAAVGMLINLVLVGLITAWSHRVIRRDRIATPAVESEGDRSVEIESLEARLRELRDLQRADELRSEIAQLEAELELTPAARIEAELAA